MNDAPALKPRVQIEGATAVFWSQSSAVEFLRAWTTGQVGQGPHSEHTGNRLADVPEAGRVISHWNPGPQLANLVGGVSGGYVALVCDEAAGLAAASLCDHFVPVITLDLDITYLRPLFSGQTYSVEGEVVHPGRQRVVSDARIRNADGKLCATARGSFIYNTAYSDRIRADLAARDPAV